MSWWKRLFNRPKPPPSWAGFADLASFEAFMVALEAALLTRGVEDTGALRSTGTLLYWPEGEDAREVHLWALAAECSETEPGAWQKRIERGLDEALGAAGAPPGDEGDEDVDEDGDGDDLGGAPGDPGGVVKTLRLQVFGAAYLSVVTIDAIVHERLAEGLYAVLVRDLGGSEATVAREDVKGWDVPEQQLLRYARQLSVAAMNEQVQVARRTGPEGDIDVFVSNAFFLGSCMLELIDQLPGGAVAFVVPLTWHHWLLHVVGPTSRPPVVTAMRTLAGQLHGTVNVSVAEEIGTDVYTWRRDTGFVRVAFEEDQPLLAPEILAAFPPA